MGSGGSSVKISLDKAHQSSLSAVILPPVAGLAYLFFQRTVLLCTESAHLPFFKQGLSSRSLSQPQACLSLSFNYPPPPQLHQVGGQNLTCILAGLALNSQGWGCRWLLSLHSISHPDSCFLTVHLAGEEKLKSKLCLL